MIRSQSSRSVALGLFALAACAPGDTTAPADTAAVPTAAQPELAVVSNSWTTAAPMPFVELVNFGAAAINNSLDQPVVYLVGGSTSDGGMNIQTLTYNAATNTWRRKDPDNGLIIIRTRPAGLVRLNSTLYIMGGLNLREGFGETSGNSLWPGTQTYVTSTNTVGSAAEWPRRSANGVAGVINGRIYDVIGSAVTNPSNCDQFFCPLVTVRELYRYDPATNTWVIRQAPPHYHRNGAGGVINGKFYVVGGFDSKGNVTRNLDVYNPATNSWTTLALLPQPLTGLKATVLQNKLYVVSPTATYAYTPSTDTWVQKALGPAGSAARVAGGAAVTVTLNGRERMIVVGGARTAAGELPKTAIYTP